MGGTENIGGGEAKIPHRVKFVAPSMVLLPWGHREHRSKLRPKRYGHKSPTKKRFCGCPGDRGATRRGIRVANSLACRTNKKKGGGEGDGGVPIRNSYERDPPRVAGWTVSPKRPPQGYCGQGEEETGRNGGEGDRLLPQSKVKDGKKGIDSMHTKHTNSKSFWGFDSMGRGGGGGQWNKHRSPLRPPPGSCPCPIKKYPTVDDGVCRRAIPPDFRCSSYK